MFKKHDESENIAPTSLRPGGDSAQSLDRKSSSPSVSTSSVSTGVASIGPTIRINGDISGNEDLIIRGEISGSIALPENIVTIGKEGSIDADVHAKSVEIEGHVAGTVHASELVRVKPSGQVTGDIAAPRVVLEDGCQFKGGIDMQETRQPATSNKPETTRKSNGASAIHKPAQDKIIDEGSMLKAS